MSARFFKRSGSYTLIITGACFSIQAVGVGMYISYGVFFNPLMEAFGWPRAAVSGASSAAFFVTGLFAMMLGRLNDRFGPRIIMTVAAIFFGAGLCLMSQVSTLFQLYLVFGLIFGIGLSSIDIIALTTIARWFSTNRGKMTGLVKVGTGAGQLIFPLLASFLIARVGFQQAFVYLGILSFLLLMGIARLLHRDPDIYYNTNKTRTRPDSRSDSQPAQTTGITFAQALKTHELWLLCAINLVVVFCLMSIMIHIVPHARDIGIPVHHAAGVLSTIGAISMTGRFAAGMLIDWVGSKRIMIACFALLIISLTGLTQADSLFKLYAFALVYGIAHGGFFTAISPIVAELFGIRAHGSLFGIVLFFGTAGGSLGPLTTGFLFDHFQSYAVAFRLLVGIIGLATALILCLRVKR